MTAGVLGGAFDPPHLGHVALARRALQALELRRLIVVVVGEAPHKRVDTTPETRYELAVAAFAGLPGVELSRQELEREGPSYTVDTARWARSRYGDVLFVVGADEFADFLEWKDPDGVLAHAELAVATRPGFRRERLEAVLAQLARPARVRFFDLEPIPIASRDVRARVARGEPIDALVPPAVATLIREHGLYAAST